MTKIDLKSMSLPELNALKSRVDQAITRVEKKERTKALKALKVKAKSLGFSLEDLVGQSDKPAKAKPKKPRKPAKIAYRHPDDSSLTWVGRGPRPKWLRDLLAKGKKLEDFKV